MKDQISRQTWRSKFPRRLSLLALPLLALALGLLAPGHQSPAEAATGSLVGSVTFSVNGTPGPDLTCTKELKPGVPPPQPGGTASYIIKCRNIGNQPTPAGIDVQLRDFLPEGSSLIFWTANGGICANNPPYVDCFRGRMAPGAEWWVEIKIKVPIRACSLINKVTIDPFDRIAETNENNNTASLTTFLGKDRCHGE